MKQDKVICIFGGAGFLGRYITQELARAGYRIKIATRVPEGAYELKTYGTVGQISAYQCDYNNPESIHKAVQGCDGVINLVGILYQKGKNKFTRAHVDIARHIATACKDHNVDKFIHVSALGIDQSQSKYAKSKLEGENAVTEIFPSVSILRPSVVFGAGDNFFSMFARMAIFLPALPLIGGGQTKFQPVFVGDIAEAATAMINAKDDQYEGQIYEAAGPEILTFKQVYERVFEQINRTPRLINVPWRIAKIQGFVFGFMPKPLLTVDQVRSLKTDNIASADAKQLNDLGVEPTAMAGILPRYLSCYKRGGRFANKKAA